MNLSKFTDYALRLCLYLVANQDKIVPVSEIADAHQLPQSSLLKVVQRLVEGEFLLSARGRTGGVQLSRSATEIRIGDLVQFMEGDTEMVDCTGCLLQGSCGLTKTLREAKRDFYKSLNRSSLADAALSHPRTLALLLAASPKG
ncbi:Rrf2 family transcriptional regulator [Sinirhodobacter sp. WL0062]|uniref:Rrf2 family transcriptional regulator n=1 Tax=Rhodobacter flavimaris TaxID=2907145 RepID=A0ABS8Z2Y7_9RHOB|nr:Rrf2 family transcriptional regulator [Sinirhodobacter sp. WL0062]